MPLSPQITAILMLSLNSIRDFCCFPCMAQKGVHTRRVIRVNRDRGPLRIRLVNLAHGVQSKLVRWTLVVLLCVICSIKFGLKRKEITVRRRARLYRLTQDHSMRIHCIAKMKELSSGHFVDSLSVLYENNRICGARKALITYTKAWGI